MSKGRDWNAVQAVKLLKYFLRTKKEKVRIELNLYTEDKAVIRAFLDSDSVKPELIIYINDRFDVFIDSKHKVGHSRCYCKAETKDTVRKWLPELFVEKEEEDDEFGKQMDNSVQKPRSKS